MTMNRSATSPEQLMTIFAERAAGGDATGLIELGSSCTNPTVCSNRGGRLGRLASPIVAWQSRRMGRRALAAFKFLAEHGRAAPVRHAILPTAHSTC